MTIDRVKLRKSVAASALLLIPACTSFAAIGYVAEPQYETACACENDKPEQASWSARDFLVVVLVVVAFALVMFWVRRIDQIWKGID